MTYRPSPEVMRIAIMGERYGSGDMQTICRAFHEPHQSSLIPTGEEAQPGPDPTPAVPAAAEFWPCVPVEYFDETTEMGDG